MKIKALNILGIMSGTSLDGLDLALCKFWEENETIKFELINAKTTSYEPSWRARLENVFAASAEEYFKLNSLYGCFIADEVNDFITKNNLRVDYIASHGHTVFHRPQQGFTTQIGCGATISAKTGISTICDFRSVDVALGGQGAPLVPIGDRDLFYQYEACLNIGGIANISFTKQQQTLAFDICYANMVLNYLCQSLHIPFDNGGSIAKTGTVNSELLKKLNNIQTYRQSLGRELFEQHIMPLLNASTLSTENKLCTCTEYTAFAIAEILNTEHLNSVLITGGGAYNDFLIERIKHYYKGNITIPEKNIIEFKEAIIFAYLGYLRINNATNTLNSVTKASKNTVGGCMYIGSICR